MLNSQARRFGEALVERHVLAKDALEIAVEAAVESGRELPAVIAELYDISDDHLAAASAAALGIRYVDFENDVVEPEAVVALRQEDAIAHRVVPVTVEGDEVVVAFEYPLQNTTVEAVGTLLAQGGHGIIVALAEPAGIQAAQAAAYGLETGVSAARHAADEAANEINRLFNRLLEMGGSDLHLAANQPPFIRVVGELYPMPDEPVLSAGRVRELIYSILTPRQQRRFEETLELDTSHSLGTRSRFRVNVYVQRNAVGAAFRVIPYEVVPFDQLGLPEVVRGFADLPRGLVVVTGPTGSGKSTTLASIVDIVNSTRRCHIITIEDPVEFVHRSKTALVNQREVGSDTNGFSVALTSAMRQDPDVILVGEMRDHETISTAITAAETGHLVFATLHTQDAPSTIDRIIDVFPAEQQSQVRVQLANSLQGVVTQQLVPTVDGRSRVVASEVMIANHPVRALIREGKIHQIHNAMMQGKRVGMQQMNESLAALVRAGAVTAEEAMRRTGNADDLARMIGVPAPTAG